MQVGGTRQGRPVSQVDSSQDSLPHRWAGRPRLGAGGLRSRGRPGGGAGREEAGRRRGGEVAGRVGGGGLGDETLDGALLPAAAAAGGAGRRGHGASCALTRARGGGGGCGAGAGALAAWRWRWCPEMRPSPGARCCPPAPHSASAGTGPAWGGASRVPNFQRDGGMMMV